MHARGHRTPESMRRKNEVSFVPSERGVTLLGGNVDESPQAYKDIETVVAAQSDLIDVLGKFTPRLVRMAEEAGEF